ncbi:hypothetical protein DPMN_006817 [Dreissena polymorpha]|uniref:Uncharacterized protein n=1 Tax=Dreissena polymorpha TaxID=45954 RepID=A0A9D4RVB9_DREPO|nr:hypothetical protein DPMN_006817 [Dreissena polymorpha]
MNVALTRARHHLLIHCNRYADGVQCADEARFGMEQYLLSCSLALEKSAKGDNSQTTANDVELFDYTETEIIDKENLQKAEKAVMNVTSDDEEMVGSEENQSNCSNDVYGTSHEDEDFSLMHSAK